ncbi:MAG: BamA/TamA family outer membrane protein [Saprospiraceae bacterium]|nr:BamA/TamA family outer membrane protein [Saprospiraceae bacterium]
MSITQTRPNRLFSVFSITRISSLVMMILCVSTLDAQQIADYTQKQEYEIGEVTIVGANYSDENAIRVVSGLKKGKKITIPGDDIGNAMRALWKQKLFTNIEIIQEKVIGDVVFLRIELEERPRLSKFTYKGTKKVYHEDLNDAVKPFLLRGGIVTEATKMNSKNAIEKYFIKKGYLDVEVTPVEKVDDKLRNSIVLEFEVDRKDRVKIEEITFSGNTHAKDKKLRKQMKNTKHRKRFLASSKYIKDDYVEDKDAVIRYYNTIGFRDARITGDSIWRDEEGKLWMNLDVVEGNRYFFRDITWKGNSIYEDEQLQERLGIQAGDVYNQELLETRLQFSQDGRDVSSLYMDNGYLFFRVDPTEIAIDNDSIDLEMRIFEGPQATIDRVTILGNDRTHEHVVRRAIRSRPGDKFSRAELIRSQREVINLGYFDPETMAVNTPVNANRGTVDIEYVLEEKSSDQLELSAGYQPSTAFFRGGLLGTLGVTFNNFSLRNFFTKGAWTPLPQGDGQKLSLRAQTNGKFYQSYNFSFTEPWLGGKKPSSFTLAAFFTQNARFTNIDQTLSIEQLSVGLGSRLNWPDDNFVTNTTINLQNIRLNDFIGVFRLPDGRNIARGVFHNFYLQQTFARSTVADPIFPKDGSNISLTLQVTPPYSIFRNKDYSELQPAELYKWTEYHKWKFVAEWYKTVFGKAVLKATAKIGMLGFFNRQIGDTPFERFQLGAEPLATQFTILGQDQIILRGYDIEAVNGNSIGGSSIYDKFNIELRYPLSLNPSSTIFVLAFVEGGNAWNSFREFNPFNLRRSAGLGARVFLPMFGTLGFDYGIGFDKPDIINRPEGFKWTDLGKFTVILGFEPE